MWDMCMWTWRKDGLREEEGEIIWGILVYRLLFLKISIPLQGCDRIFFGVAIPV